MVELIIEILFLVDIIELNVFFNILKDKEESMIN